MLTQTAEVFYPHLLDEVVALNRANDMVSKPSEETIFVAKAIVLMWTEKEPREGVLGWEGWISSICLTRIRSRSRNRWRSASG